MLGGVDLFPQVTRDPMVKQSSANKAADVPCDLAVLIKQDLVRNSGLFGILLLRLRFSPLVCFDGERRIKGIAKSSCTLESSPFVSVDESYARISLCEGSE